MFEKRFSDLRKLAVAALLLTVSMMCGRTDAAPGPLALGGAPGQSSGLYRVTPGGDLTRIWRDGSAWQCLNLAKWGAPLNQDLISGERGVIYGVNQEGRMIDTYFNGPVSRFATIDVTSGLLPRTLALGGDADGNTGVYGIDARGGIVRAWWSGNPGWKFETVPTWGGRIVPGSLIAGESRVYGVNEFGKIVNTYPDSGVIKFGVIEGRSDLVPGSLALGGSPKANTGVYGVNRSGLLVRAFWNNGAWAFQSISAGSSLVPGSLISGYGWVYGLNTKGQIVLGYVDASGALKTSLFTTISGLVPGSLALGGPAKTVNDIYGVDAKGQLIRTYYNPQPPLRRWVSSLVRGVIASPKMLISGDDGVFGLDTTGRPFAVTLVNGVPTVVYPCPLPSPGEAQRKTHAAVLQAFGIDSLTSLGPLSLSGDVVPQTGLLRPRPDLVAGTVAIQAARRAALVNNQRQFVPLVVNANLLKAEPFPKASANKIDIPLDTAYIAAASLDLADNTHLILKFPNRHLVILAEDLKVGQNVTVTYERQPATPPTKPGKPGKPGTPAVPNPFSKGNHGANGTAGTAGAKGWSFTSSPAPEVEVWVLSMTGSPAFDLRGQDGGAGGAGGDGGDGGNGSAGSPSETNTLGFNCKSGPGDGGDGGNGGKAGDGGPGGDGAPGGRLTFYAPSPVIAAFVSGFFVTVDGGSAGPGGIPGTPGAGGDGGPVGQNTHSVCNQPASTRHSGKSGAQGAPASQGAPGKAGLPQTPNPLSLLPIQPNDFVQALDKPALESLTVPGPQSGRAFEGQTVSVKGKHFSGGDTILIDDGAGGWVFCNTQLLGDTLLSFQVPAVRGGLHTVLLEQTTTAKHSNAISLYVLPKLDATQPGPRIRPGSIVTVKGTGFAPGMNAFLSGQPGSILSYVDPHTLQLSVMRPKSFPEPPNSDGDAADLALALADGTFSNSIPVLLDTYRIVVLGDSVAWGTGLQEPEKFSALVAQRVRDLNQASNLGVFREVRAHTGAILGLGLQPPLQPGLPPIPGEVPTSYPTISEQLDLYAGSSNAAYVDLVLVDGCINDIGVFTILDPQRSPSNLDPEIEQGCHDDMLELLKKAAVLFPQARIVVNGYFAPLGHDSAFAGPLLVAFLIAIDHPIVKVPGEIVAGVLKPGTRDQIVENALYFEAKSSEQLHLAVTDATQQLGGPARIFFADAHFGSQHAALSGPSSWLFGINLDTSPQDNPVVASARKAACDQYKSRTDYVTCVHASAGHPNITGAQKFAEAIFPFL